MTTPMTRPGRLALAFLVASAVAPPGAKAETPPPPPPPRQADPWTPPATTLPRFLVSATAALCDQGLPDPRGCDYRSIRIAVVADSEGETREVATAGWLLPAGGPADDRARHAIAWDGLIYAVMGGAGPADLDRDVRRLVEAAPGRGEGAAQGQAQGFGFAGRRGMMGFAQPDRVLPETFDPIKVCLLFRAGRADLAEAAWASRFGPPSGAKVDLKPYGVSYLTLATDWTLARYARALGAHVGGDDAFALAELRGLAAFERAAEAHADRLGFERPTRGDSPGGLTPYFALLDRLPEVLADQERRAAERANPRPAPRGGSRDARISRLIRELDEVRFRASDPQMAFAPRLRDLPAIEDLVAEGDAAIEPLLWAFRSDDRLTRSAGWFGSWTDANRGTRGIQGIQGVSELAHVALIAILKPDGTALPLYSRSRADAAERARVADSIEAYWKKNRDVTPADRWYRTLLDDDAGGSAWIEAAAKICQPATPRPTTPAPRGGPGPRKSALVGVRPLPLGGEALRKGHEPTVTALLARRSATLLKESSGNEGDLGGPAGLALSLAKWDPIAAGPTLREVARVALLRYAGPGDHGRWQRPMLAGTIARLTVARDEAGDPGALRDYADWIRTTSPVDIVEHGSFEALDPIARRPADPAIRAVAAWLFGDPGSPWNPIYGRPGSLGKFQLASSISSSLVENADFRAMLLRMLDDRTVIGRAEAGDNGAANVTIDGGGRMGHWMAKDAVDPAPKGASAPLRLGDFYAWQLARIEAAPAFHPAWPEPRRDAAIAGFAAFLRAKDGPAAGLGP